ncbi:MAG TPA: hypothetical protein GX505_03060 [Clostridiales bacterium]|nr:hypothetical protein [Clostridiales bacterium]
MNMVQEFFNQLSLDLAIRRYSCESESSYYSRLIYSAIGCWILYCTGDKNIEEDISRYGVSKNYINRRCSKILNNFLEIYPQAQDWFFTDNIADYTDVIRYIREIYEFLGYLVSAGLDSSLILPICRKVIVEDGLALYRGVSKVSPMIGLGTYKYMKEVRKEDIALLFDMFLVPNKRADKFVQDYIKKIKWGAGGVSENTQFFEYKSKNSLSESWINTWTQDTITIYKNSLLDYGLVKFEEGQLYTSKFPDHIVNEKEVRRFMYGLKGNNGSNMKAKLKMHSDVAVLRLFSKLPEREMMLLRVLSWPVNFIEDVYNYYIPLEVINVIKKILGNLCIEVEEV